MAVITNPWFMLFVLFTYFYFTFHICHGAATITANQSLSGDKTIVSSGGAYELGFFKPGSSSKHYIGIWYQKLSPQTVVWVANREQPVSDRYSSELRILDGNLVLLNESRIPIWSTNLSSTSPSSFIEVVLLDTGNLVLRDGSNSVEPLWQSFDHPTDTWLPGGKVGVNKIMKKSIRLIPWKSKDDPSPGLFSLEPDLNESQYVIIWNRSRQYWTSGVWNGQRFSLIPEMSLNHFYNFSYVNNENESYFTYSLYNSSMISQTVIDVGGQMQQWLWLDSSESWFRFWSQPRGQCEVYAYCGAFGSCNVKSQYFCNCLTGFSPKSVDDWNSGVFYGGCVRRTSLQCGNPSPFTRKRDRFFPSYSMQFIENPKREAVGNAQECEATCLNNCSCTAYSFDNNQCSLWFGDLLDLQQLADHDPNGTTLYIRLAASEFSSSKSNKGIVIGVVVGSVVIVLLLSLCFFVILRRGKRTSTMGKAVERSLMAFTYRDLQKATKNFSEKLGGGGFGSVFKGILPDSSVIAVKKLESISQGEKQFRTEVSIIGAIQHVNLIRLRGFCSEATKKLLVYEYMANGSLDSHLFSEKDSKMLDWETRFSIALGTARGLAYLHEKCRDCIIHCDIKPENILLDADFSPKVADFGLAKLVGRDLSRVLTTMRGTIGYLAPEWISGVAITVKADVYSFGIMLFEFVSGRRNYEQSKYGKMEYFPLLVASLINEYGNVLSLLDPRLEGNADVEELTRVCKVACWCIQEEETQRPSMGQVVHMLEQNLEVSLPPIPRFLQSLGDNEEHTVCLTKSS